MDECQNTNIDGLIQCKLIHRTYYTNHRLSKFYPNVADTCNRCATNHRQTLSMCFGHVQSWQTFGLQYLTLFWGGGLKNVSTVSYLSILFNIGYTLLYDLCSIKHIYCIKKILTNVRHMRQ